MLDEQMGQLRCEGEELVDLHHALRLALCERVGREFIEGADDFSEQDERRAEELVALISGAGA